MTERRRRRRSPGPAPASATAGELAAVPPPPRPLGTVAIVGRPNVGKSTLFNRLVGRRQAIVHDQPGVTRDRIGAVATLDDGASVHLVDTGGLLVGDEDVLGLNRQVLAAVAESDLLVLVVDGGTGLTSADERVWERLRREGRPAVLVVNKADQRRAVEAFDEFARLGIEPRLLVSAEHGLGVGDLREALVRMLPAPVAGPAPDPEAPAVAVVGRPNVGKSTLLNRLVGDERSLVSPTAGTTRDPVDSPIEHQGHRYVLVDTAGIRRRSQVGDAPEELAVMMARRQIARAAMAVLVIDATAGVTSGDLAIADAAWQGGCGVLVVVNKWDLLDDEGRRLLEESWRRLDELLGQPLRVNVSAWTGRAIDRLMPALHRLRAAHGLRVETAALNRLLEKATARHQAPTERGRPWRLYYGTQVSTAPPTFMLFANRALPRNSGYRRYLENQLREALELPGVPLRLVVRRREPARKPEAV